MHADLRSDHTLRLSPGSTSSMRPIIGSGPTGPTGATGIQGPPGPGTGAGAWVASTAYATNQVVQAPDGSIIYRISAGTSRPSFDATEAALWAAVSTKTGTIDQVALSTAFEYPEFYVDFTTKANGPAPTVGDTGQAVTTTHSSGGSNAKIVSGRLVADPGAATSYASYFQPTLAADGVRIGCEWTQSSLDAGDGGLCLALWASVYNLGPTVPQARVHLSIIPGTGVWLFWVCDGAGHLVQVDQGTFVKQPADGVARWVAEAYADPDTGNVYLYLPDGQVVVVTAATIATNAVLGGFASPPTIGGLSGQVAVLEHYAATNGLTAAMPKYTKFWVDSRPMPASKRTFDPLRVVKAVAANQADRYYTQVASGDLTNGFTINASNPPRYRRISDGKVRIAGYFQAGTAGLSAYTLPVGLRPGRLTPLPGVTGSGTFGYVFANTDGTIVPAAVPMWIDAEIDTAI